MSRQTRYRNMVKVSERHGAGEWLTEKVLLALLMPQFDVQVLEHDYQRIEPWAGEAGNALFVCVRR